MRKVAVAVGSLQVVLHHVVLEAQLASGGLYVPRHLLQFFQLTFGTLQQAKPRHIREIDICLHTLLLRKLHSLNFLVLLLGFMLSPALLSDVCLGLDRD